MATSDVRHPLKEIILRAWTDPSFKESLTADPGAVLRDFGLKTSEASRIVVIENTAETSYLVLPRRPDLENLTEEQIRELVDSVMGVQLVLPTILASY